MDLYKTIFRIDFNPLASAVVSLPEMARRASTFFPDLVRIGENGDILVVSDPIRHCSLSLGYGKLIYDEDHADDEQAAKRASVIFDIFNEEGGLGEIMRVGLRRIYLSRYNGSMAKLVKLLQAKLYSDAPSGKALFPFPVRDLNYVIDYADGDRHVHLRIAPCEREELPGLLAIKKGHFWRDEKILSRLLDELPGISTYYDVDIFRIDKPITPVYAREALDSWGGEIKKRITALESMIHKQQ